MTDQQAFLEAYKHIRTDIERFALFVCRNRNDAKDALQDALLAACKSWSAIGDATRLRSYINSAATRIRARRRERDARYEGDVDMESMRCLNAPPDALAEMNQLRDAIGSLDDDQRIPLLLAEIEGWPLQEVADTLGLSLSAVKMRLKRGRDQLRKRMNVTTEVLKEAGHDRE